MNFYWVGIEDSQIFKTLLGKKKRRTGYVVNEDWIKDAGENATIIWEWWKPIFMDDEYFPCFHLALCLIDLIQLLSCAAEQVFHK